MKRIIGRKTAGIISLILVTFLIIGLIPVSAFKDSESTSTVHAADTKYYSFTYHCNKGSTQTIEEKDMETDLPRTIDIRELANRMGLIDDLHVWTLYVQLVYPEVDSEKVTADNENQCFIINKTFSDPVVVRIICQAQGVGGGAMYNCDVEVTCTSHEHDGASFREWTDELAAEQNGSGKTAENSLPRSEGNYYLTKDVTYDGGWSYDGSIYLCLNGHNVNLKGCVYVNGGKTFGLYDCQDSGKLSSSNDGAIYTYSNGNLNIYGGTVSSKKYGIIVSGITNIYGGTITGVAENSDTNRAGVVVYSGATLNVYGGNITGNNIWYGDVLVDGNCNYYGGKIGVLSVTKKSKFNIAGTLDSSNKIIAKRIEGTTSSTKKIIPGVFTKNFSTKHSDPADYFISESDDYIVTLKGGEAAFLKPISPTVSITDWTYGDDPSEPDVQGNTGSGEVTYEYKKADADDNTYTTDVPTNAGEYLLRATIAPTDEYAGASCTANFKISPVSLTVTAKDSTIKFGEAGKGNGVTYDGFIEGDTEAVLSGTLSYAFTDSEGDDYEVFDPVGTYVITPMGLSSENYEIDFIPGTLTVTKNTISPTVSVVDWTYGEEASAPTVSGNKGGGEETFKYKKKTDPDSEYSSDVPTHAGEYMVKASIAESDGYEGAECVANFKIKKAALTVTAKDFTIRYNEDGKDDGVTYDGFVNGDTKDDLSGTLTFSFEDKDGNEYKAGDPVGTYKIIPSGLTSKDYEIEFEEGTLTVVKNTSKPAVTITDWTYGADPSTPSVTGNTGGGEETFKYKKKSDPDTAYSKNVPTEAGEYTIQATIAATAGYEETTCTANFKIKKASLTVKAKDAEIYYGEEGKNNGATITGFVEGETIDDLSGTLKYSIVDKDGNEYKPGDPAGVYAIKPSGLSSKNYDIEYTDGELTVMKKTSGPSVMIVDWVYGEAPGEPKVTGYEGTGKITYEFKELNAPDSTYTKDVPTNAGEYMVRATIEPTEEYEGATCTANFKISRAPLTVTAKNATIKFGEDAKADGVTYTGFVNGDTEAVLLGSLSYDFTDSEGNKYKPGDPAGNYVITPSGFTAANYEIDYEDGILTVVKKTATPTVTIANWTYGDTPATPSVTGYPGEGKITYTYKAKTAAEYTEAVPVNAGDYTVKATIAETAEYEEVSCTADFKIKKASLTITAKDTTIKYGEEGKNDGVGYKGFVNGDNKNSLSGTLVISIASDDGNEYKPGDPAGKYNIIPSGLSSDNYDIEYKNGTMTVEKKTSEPQVLITDWTYGDTPSNPSVTGYPGEGTIVYEYKIKDAAETTYTRNVPEDAGEYVVRAKIAETEEYEAATCFANFKIMKASLKVTAKDFTIRHGSEGKTDGVTFDGFVNGDTQDDLKGTLSYFIANDEGVEYKAGDPAGTYKITPSGLTSFNYEIEFIDGTLTVVKNTADPAVSITDWKYGETASTPSVTGNTGEGEVTIEYKVKGADDTTYTDKVPVNVGEYTVRASIAETAGYEASSCTADFKINKAALKITAKNLTVRYGEEGKTDGVTYETFVNGDTEESLSGKLTFKITDSNGKEYKAGDPVGDYVITPSGLTSNNYEITYATGTMSVVKLPGGATFKVVLQEGVKGFSIDNTEEEVLSAVLTDEDKKILEDGGEVQYYLQIKKGNPTSDEKSSVEKLAGEKSVIGEYYDISLFKQVTGKEVEQLSSSAIEFILNFKISGDLINEDSKIMRYYSVIRIHNGDAEKIDSNYEDKNKTLVAYSDLFSIYALTYVDLDAPTTQEPTSSTTQATTASTSTKDTKGTGTTTTTVDGKKTGDSTNVAVLIIIMVLMIVAVGITFIIKKKINKK